MAASSEQTGMSFDRFSRLEQKRTYGQGIGPNKKNRNDGGGPFNKLAKPNEILGNIKQKYNNAVVSFGIFHYDLNKMLNNDWVDELEF